MYSIKAVLQPKLLKMTIHYCQPTNNTSVSILCGGAKRLLCFHLRQSFTSILLTGMKDAMPTSQTNETVSMAVEQTPHALAKKYIYNILNDGTDNDATKDVAISAHNSDARPTDIVLNTHPKSGTVLLQQMCYQIAVISGGLAADGRTEEDFDDIIKVVPWIEREHILKCGPPTINPRVFKTHLSINEVGKCSKHIVLVRDPTKFAASFLNFLFFPANPDLDGKFPEDDRIMQECVDVLTEKFIIKSGGNDLGGWHKKLLEGMQHAQSNPGRTLVIFYEDVVSDLKGYIRKIAKFMGCSLSDEDVTTVAQRCDRDAMAQDSRFHGLYEYKGLGFESKLIHVFPEGYQGFKKYKVSASLVEQISKMTKDCFGVDSYDDLRKAAFEQQLQILGC